MSSVSALNSLLSSSTTSASSIDLSSILQTTTNASSSGIDVTSAVNAAITAAQAPETAWENQISTLQSQATALQQLQSDTSKLDNDIQALNSITGPLSARTVTSSNSAAVTASAAAGSTPGNHVLVVSNLATTASWTSGVFAASTTALPAGSFTITTGTGATATITTDGTQTVSDVASQINGDNLGLSANVITDANGSRLAIVAKSSGSAANFTVTGDAGFGFAQAATGTNAALTVDGIPISSASNTVTGTIPGVTFNLLSANPGVEVSLGVNPDSTSAASAINQFVTDYNTVISELSSQFTFNGTSEGVLATDSSVRSLQVDLLSSLGYSYTPATGTTTVSNLSALGITANNDGTLSVNSSTLQSVLQNNNSDVQSFFQGAALNGFANSLDQQLTSFTSPSNGAFTVDLKSISSQENDLASNISNFETNYIAPLRTRLQAEYSQAEILLQQLPAEMKQISVELGQNTSTNG